ncbi:copper homeostasis protein CutC [Pontibacter silvestris]|uniref:PF03932 family protein CutC n=1 Tax=Pontibacter silvestris TaxID=2305183 RepID=A0ABW4WTU9_9BACT|nr:copper homeostasis protein CutC [Pontibacter silvestris]MCC9137867.1 copper homeostasis protein CutC [Pontibacter silvestris]
MLSTSCKGEPGEKLVAEICVDSVYSAAVAESAGAQRVELCSSLAEGGVTPSAGLIEITRKNISIGLHVLIRPRRGDFLYSDLEFEIMKKDIELAKRMGADGVVIGILKADGNIDVGRTRELIEVSHPLSVTFHRAFDLTPDPFKSLEDLLALKVDRLLTSGQEETALQGAALIKELVKKSANQLIVMPGGGINENNISKIVAITGVKEFHASARKKVSSSMGYCRNYPAMSSMQQLSEYENLVADVNKIRAIREVSATVR